MSVSDIAAAFQAQARAILAQISETQMDSMRQAAGLMADTAQRGGIIYAFGSGHSQSVAHEFYYRAGGLACCDVIHEKTFGRAERLSGYAAVLLDQYPVAAGDLLIVVSNSGRNALSVELAQHAAARGLKVVAITSLAHSRAVAARIPGGKRLFEVCDAVIDTCGPLGDATTRVDDRVTVGGVSTLAGVFIAQTLVCLTVEALLQRGVGAPVLRSMNVDGGDGTNEESLARYRNRIRGL